MVMHRTPRQLHASDYKVGRDAKTGKYFPVKESSSQKSTPAIGSMKKKK